MSTREQSVKNLLENVNISTESIQGASKWIMKHRDEIDVITRVWSELYGKGSDNLKIALVYVMNEVVQNAKHERDKTTPMAFHPHVVNAATFALSNDVKKAINRCLEVFKQRCIYPEHVIEEMKAALDGSVDSVPDTEDISDFDIDQFRKRLEHYRDACNSIDRARQILDSINFEYDADDARIKSKQGVIEMEHEVDQMIEKLQKFTNSIEGQYKRTLKVKQLNQRAIKYYDVQLKDICTVHEAYERFAKGIESSRSFLQTIVQTGVLPGQTPPEAPSPTPSEGQADSNGDDMDIEEEDGKPSNNGSALISPKDYNPFPVYNNLPNTYQPQTANNIAKIKADPRKMRAAPASTNPVPIQYPWAPVPNQPPPNVQMPMPINIPPPGFIPLPTPELPSPSQQPGMGFFQKQMRPRGMMAPRGGGNQQFFSQRDAHPQFVGNQQSWRNQNFRGNFQESPSNRRRSEEFAHNDYQSPKRVRRGGSTAYD